MSGAVEERPRGRSYSRSRSQSRSRSPPPFPTTRAAGSRSPSPPARRRSRSADDGTRSKRRSRSRSRSPVDRPAYRPRRPDPSAREDPEPSRVLGVFGLNVKTSERDLEDLFAEFGALEKVSIIQHHSTLKSRGFGFVTFIDTEGATMARKEMNGQKVHDHKIRVDYSVTQRPHSPTPGRYMGRDERRRSYRPSRRDDYDRRGSRGGYDRDRDDSYGRDRYDRDRSDRHDRYDRYDRYDRHDRHDRHDRYDRHDRHDRHERSDRGDRGDRGDRHDDYRSRRD